MNEVNGDLQQRLAETFDALAQLAHKMNNPLTALIGRAQLLQMVADDPDGKVSRAATVIEQSATRVASHVGELGLLVRDARELLASTPTEKCSPEPETVGS